MRVASLPDVEPGSRPRKVAIGTFDGVHRGHREVIRGADTVLTFDPHPLSVIRPEATPKLISTFNVKRDLIAGLGVDELVVIPFDNGFASLTAEEFVREVLTSLANRSMIIGVDTNNAKRPWGERFGMTHFVNPAEVGGDLVPHLVNMTKSGADQIGGADYTFDCTGNVTVMRQALEACHRGWGQSIIIGVAPAGAEIATRPFQLVTGRVWKGTAFGGARGRTDVPKIVDWYMDNKINIDDLITHTMPLERINDAFDLMHAGKSIRSVILY